MSAHLYNNLKWDKNIRITQKQNGTKRGVFLELNLILVGSQTIPEILETDLKQVLEGHLRRCQ